MHPNSTMKQQLPANHCNISCGNIKQICKSILRMAIELETLKIDPTTYTSFHMATNQIVLCPWSFLFFKLLNIHLNTLRRRRNLFWSFLFFQLLIIHLNTLRRGRKLFLFFPFFFNYSIFIRIH